MALLAMVPAPMHLYATMTTKQPRTPGAKAPKAVNTKVAATLGAVHQQQYADLLRQQRAAVRALRAQHRQQLQALLAGFVSGTRTPYAKVVAAMPAPGRGPQCALTAAQQAAVLAAPATVSHTALARDYGVSVATISRLRNGLTAKATFVK